MNAPTREPIAVDFDVHLVRTPGIYSYLDVQFVADCPMYALRRIRRSRPGWHFLLALSWLRVYAGVGP